MTEQQKLEAIQEVMEKKFKEPEFDDFFFVDSRVLKNNKIEVFVDSDTVLDLGACTKLNRHLQEFLDEKQYFGEKYTLDVSSPGIDRPLTFYRQYLKNIGRNVKVVLNDDSIQEGKLVKVEESEIQILIKEKKKETESMIQMNDIKEIYVQISFK